VRQIPISLDRADEVVPALLTLPDASGATDLAPAAVLLHGYSSNKERMASSIGRALARAGVASLAIDLPLHGAREMGVENMSLRNPLALVQKWRLALAEVGDAIHYLAEHRAIDPRRLALVGYSLGAYIAVVAAATNPLVRAVVLAAGGDLPERTPFAAIVRTIADPLRAVRALDGRPLLMVNGKNDRTVLPSQARALFESADEPKELHWYAGGHWPPQSAIDYTATWLAGALETHSRASSTATL
jgi:dienelactone hydrolase